LNELSPQRAAGYHVSFAKKCFAAFIPAASSGDECRHFDKIWSFHFRHPELVEGSAFNTLLQLSEQAVTGKWASPDLTDSEGKDLVLLLS
jgi:hypothetical protein